MNLIEVHMRLLKYFGKQGWWPAETPFEVVVGAVLVQRTTWRNVEWALANLKTAGLLNPKALSMADIRLVEELVKPAGFYRQKAQRIVMFSKYLVAKYEGSLDKLLRGSLEGVRQELLSMEGIGPETADSILLYAAHKPVFPIDLYVKRILKRLGLIPSLNLAYEDVQSLVQEGLPASVEVYKELRALMVRLGKTYCRKKPLCLKCPLTDICAHSL